VAHWREARAVLHILNWFFANRRDDILSFEDMKEGLPRLWIRETSNRFGLSPVQEVKHAVKRAVKRPQTRPEFPPTTYFVTFLFVAFVIVLALVLRKGKPR
jgi:hypothetical protein